MILRISPTNLKKLLNRFLNAKRPSKFVWSLKKRKRFSKLPN